MNEILTNISAVAVKSPLEYDQFVLMKIFLNIVYMFDSAS